MDDARYGDPRRCWLSDRSLPLYQGEAARACILNGGRVLPSNGGVIFLVPMKRGFILVDQRRWAEIIVERLGSVGVYVETLDGQATSSWLRRPTSPRDVIGRDQRLHLHDFYRSSRKGLGADRLPCGLPDDPSRSSPRRHKWLLA